MRQTTRISGNNGPMPGGRLAMLCRALPYLLGAFIFLNPFPATSPKEIIFYVSVLLFVVCAVMQPGRFSFSSPLNIPFLLVAAWSLLSVIFALDPASSAGDYFSHLIKLILLYAMLVNCYGDRHHLRTLSWLIIVSTSVFALAITVHWYLFLGNPWTSRLGLTYVHYGNVTNGYFTVFGLALAIHQWFDAPTPFQRGALLTMASVLAAASMLSQSRSTILALAVVIGIQLFRKPKLLMVLTVTVIAFVAFTPVKDRFTNFKGEVYTLRIGQYHYTAQIIRDYPIFGIGYSLDTFRDDRYIDRNAYMSRIPAAYQQPSHPYYFPHNMFFSMALRTGIPGGIFFSLLFVVPAVMCWRVMTRSGDNGLNGWALCGMSCLGMFFVKGNLDQVFLSFAEIIFMTILAMITVTWNLYRHNDPKYRPQAAERGSDGAMHQ